MASVYVMAGWLANFFANTATQIMGVTNMIGALTVAGLAALFGCIHWHRRRITDGKTGVESSHIIVACLVGAALLLMGAAAAYAWQHYWSTDNPVTAATSAPSALIPNTNLRLLIRENNDPEQLSQTNIWHWFSLKERVYTIGAVARSHVTYFFLTFENPAATNHRRVFSSTHQNLEFRIVDMTPRSMVVAVLADPTGAIIDFQISENPL